MMRRIPGLVCVLAIVVGPAFAPAQEKGGKRKGGAAKKAEAPGKRKAEGKGGKKRPARQTGGRRPGPAAAAGFSDDAVAGAIDRGVKFLFSKQQASGTWGPHGNNYPVGPTAIAVYAILESGVSPQEPRIAKALLWLAKNNTDRTYGLGLRCNCWLVANRQTSDRYRPLLVRDASLLYRSTHRGAHNYPATGRPDTSRYDNSNTQFAVLGIWAADMNHVEVPMAYWRAAMEHWTGDQNSDGGWPYHKGKKGKGQQAGSRGTMTAGGLATLFICFDKLHAADFVRCNRTFDFKPISRGLDWLDRNYQRDLASGRQLYYYLYGVERVGLASGYKYFGKTDWYKQGASILLRKQSANGSWGSIPNTAFAVLFLVRGRNAIVFNKLEFDGDWNNRPRDLAGLTRWMSITFERTVNWQIINLKVPVSEWHDAPILYISGSSVPKFTDEHLRKLRTFVDQGGAIFSVTECGGAAFRRSIREVYARLFPNYKLAPVSAGHDIYTRNVHFDLPGGRPKMEILSNGVRPLVIHTDVDLSLPWQLSRSVTQRWAYEAAVNAVRYITDNITTLRPRGTTHWPPAVSSPKRQITLVRLKHEANCDPEPLAYERFSRLVARDANVTLKVVGPVAVGKLAEADAKIAAMTGTQKLELSASQIQALKAFVSGGGTLVVDAAGGSAAFADSAREILERAFAPRRLRPLASSAKVFQLAGHQITKVKYRRRTRMRLAATHAPVLRGILLNGNRVGVYFSKEDLTAGLVGYSCYTIDGYAPDSAYEILRNIVLSAAK